MLVCLKLRALPVFKDDHQPYFLWHKARTAGMLSSIAPPSIIHGTFIWDAFRFLKCSIYTDYISDHYAIQ